MQEHERHFNPTSVIRHQIDHLSSGEFLPCRGTQALGFAKDGGVEGRAGSHSSTKVHRKVQVHRDIGDHLQYKDDGTVRISQPTVLHVIYEKAHD